MSLSSRTAQELQSSREDMVRNLSRGGILGLISSLDTRTLQELEATASQELFDRHQSAQDPCSTCKGSGRSPDPSQDYTCGDCRGSGRNA